MSAAVEGPGAGMANLRDVAGLATDGGRGTRPGVLLRGDAPHPGDLPPTTVPWPPALVLDLRQPTEAADPHPLDRPGTRVLQVPLLSAGHTGDWRRLPALEKLYLGLLERLGALAASLLDEVLAADGPVLVHCAAGKDRTGVLVGLLLRAAGVTGDAVLADYLRTTANVPAVLDRLAWDLSMLGEQDRLRAQHLAGTSEPALRGVLAVLDGADGGAAGWLRAHGVEAAAVEAWRRRLIG